MKVNVNVRLACLCSLVPWGSYFDHALAWEKQIEDPNVMIVMYEELKQVRVSLHTNAIIQINIQTQQSDVVYYTEALHDVISLVLHTQNLPEEVKKISEFFGFPLTEEHVNSIAEQSTFSAMRENSNKSHGNMGSIFFRKGTRCLHVSDQSNTTPHTSQE